MLIYTLVKRRRLARGSNTSGSETENMAPVPTPAANANPNASTENAAANELKGGQVLPNLFQHPIETLSVMIDTLNHRVENL